MEGNKSIEELDKKYSEALEKLLNLMENEPLNFTKILCFYVIETDDSIVWTNYNAYLKITSTEQTRIRYKKIYHYLANLILHAVTERAGEKVKNLGGYVSLRQYIETSFIETFQTWENGHHKSMYPSVQINDIVRVFFDRVQGNYFTSMCFSVAYMINFGVPIYVKDSSSDKFTIVDKHDEDFIYLKQLGKYGDSIDWYKLADWADRFYINMEHENLHYNFMGNTCEESIEVVRAKQDAFLKLIGVDINTEITVSKFGDNSKLFNILKVVINRYYGNTFDVNDKDTWPKQKDVVEWLISEHKLSKREAESIDIVSRPDEARNKM